MAHVSRNDASGHVLIERMSLLTIFLTIFVKVQTHESVQFNAASTLPDHPENTSEEKFEDLKNEKSFLDEIEFIFHNCLRIIFW